MATKNEVADRYRLVSAYMNDQSDEQWQRLVHAVAGPLAEATKELLGDYDIDENDECPWCHKEIVVDCDRDDEDPSDEEQRCKNPKCRAFRARALLKALDE